MTLCAGAARSLKVFTWAKTLVAFAPGQPAEEVGVVGRHAHEQAAAARVGHPPARLATVPS